LDGVGNRTHVTETVSGVTREISYIYDALYRLTAADYSTGEAYAYQYDPVGNRTAYTLTTPLDGTAVTAYTYDAANRLQVAVSPGHSVTYTWDNRGNLLADGTFTYTYSAAGRMVQAQNLTATLVYTYNADGLRVAQAQSVASVQSVATFTWDWATGVPELLSDGESLYLIGYDTLGWQREDDWTFVLPDALGSVRQETDAAGTVTAVREWSPYGEEFGGAQAGCQFSPDNEPVVFT
jgi:YD repeat-containing protein